MPAPSRPRVLFGILAGLTLSALEINVVGPAAPHIAAEIGGLDSYAWMFTIYLLTATLTMPLWGRVSDLLGRKKLFLLAMFIFLVGSLLCGISQTMPQLIAARGVKGIGGGGIIPLAFSAIADHYPYRERARIQGYLSSVWGLSSVIGPFVGGTLTEILGWRSIFFINFVPGFFSFVLIQLYFHETRPSRGKLELSAGPVLSSMLTVLTLLLAFMSWQEHHIVMGGALFACSLAAGWLFYNAEKRAAYPLLSPQLLQNRVFLASCLTGFFISMMVIGLSSFGPLLFQNVLGYTPTQSGQLLMPFTLSWVVGSIISTRMLLKRHYRNLIFFGTILTTLGFLIFMLLFERLGTWSIVLTTTVMGFGMAFNYPITLITVQHSVPENQVGFATAGISWVRNIGTTIGTTVMGVALNLILKHKLSDALTGKNDRLLQDILNHPEILNKWDATLGHNLGLDFPAMLADALFWVFLIKFSAVALSLVFTFLYPKEEVKG